MHTYEVLPAAAGQRPPRVQLVRPGPRRPGAGARARRALEAARDSQHNKQDTNIFITYITINTHNNNIMSRYDYISISLSLYIYIHIIIYLSISLSLYIYIYIYICM